MARLLRVEDGMERRSSVPGDAQGDLAAQGTRYDGGSVSGAAESAESEAGAALDFSRRAQLQEMMDQPCSFDELRACLHDIARVNQLTLAYRPTLSWLATVVPSRPERAEPLRIVDVGCGYGDTLRAVAAWASRQGIPVRLTGIDLNPHAIRAAREATPASQKVNWQVGDALSGSLGAGTDVVISSLLTHHLADAEIVRFLRWMEATAQVGWFVNDLHRQPLPYHLFRVWTRVTTWHRFVKHDGPVSIRRSFVAADWQELCLAAGLAGQPVSIKAFRPARLCVGRRK